jgi:hypothetical protein
MKFLTTLASYVPGKNKTVVICAQFFQMNCSLLHPHLRFTHYCVWQLGIILDQLVDDEAQELPFRKVGVYMCCSFH